MLFRLDADQQELRDKAPAFLEQLAKALEPVAPDIAEALEKARPDPHGDASTYPVLEELQERGRVAYNQMLERMLADIGRVLDGAAGERVQKAEPLEKAGPFLGPRGGKWADPAHTIPWHEDVPHEQLTEDAHSAVRQQVVEAAHRAAAAGADPKSMKYVGAGGEGIIFEDKTGRAYKVSRRGGDKLKTEAGAIESLQGTPAAKYVPKFHSYDAKHDVLVREKIEGRPGGWSTETKARDAYDTIVAELKKKDWSAPEFKGDSFIVTGEGDNTGLVMVDMGFVRPLGQRSVQDIADKMQDPASVDLLDVPFEMRELYREGNLSFDQAMKWTEKIEAEHKDPEKMLPGHRESLESEAKRRGDLEKADEFESLVLLPDDIGELLYEHQQSEQLSKSRPYFLGPRGGKWEDAAHTIPWKEEAPQHKTADPNVVYNVLRPDTDPYGDEGMTHYYHSSPALIHKIKEGLFGKFMFFEANEKSEHSGPYHYKIIVPDGGVVKASSFFYRDDSDKLDPLVQKVMKEHDFTEEQATGLIDGSLNVWEEFPEQDSDVLAELSWAGQKYAGFAAKVLGFRGASVEDEHGTVYILNMEGHGKDLQLIDAPEDHLGKAYDSDQQLNKAAGHKYIRRIPNASPPPKYRYFYNVTGGKGLAHKDEFKQGAKFKFEHEGKKGHFEVLEAQDGQLKVRHDESGKVTDLSADKLRTMLHEHHGEAISGVAKRAKERVKQAKETGTAKHQARAKEHAAKVAEQFPQHAAELSEVDHLPKTAPALERVAMDAMGPGGYDQIEAMSSDATELERQAEAMPTDREYAVMEQAKGYVLVSKPKVTKVGKEVADGPAEFFLRNDKGTGMQGHEAQWVIMEADELVPSHNAITFDQRGDYPEGVQERRYHSIKAEQLKIDRVARTLEPSVVANDSPSPIDGAPIITETGVVLGGNGRTMGMQRAYEMYPESAAKLKDYLTMKARHFGLSPAQVEGMKKPILVRRVQAGHDKDKLTRLGRRMNEAFTQDLDPRSKEVAVSNFVTKELVQGMTQRMEVAQTMADFLSKPASRGFVGDLERAGIVDQYNRAQYVSQDTGLLNEEGRTHVVRVMAARMLPDAGVLDAMDQKLRNSLAGAVPFMMQAEENGWDIREPLLAAVRADNEMSSRGYPRDANGRKAYQSQPALIQEGENHAEAVREGMAAKLLEIVQDHNGSRKLPRGFKAFAMAADRNAHDHGDQGSMFAAPKVDPDTALAQSFNLAPEKMAAALELDGTLMKALLVDSGAQRYMWHAVMWEAKRLADAELHVALTEGGQVNYASALAKLKAHVEDMQQSDDTFAKVWAQVGPSDGQLLSALESQVESSGFGKWARNGVTKAWAAMLADLYKAEQLGLFGAKKKAARAPVQKPKPKRSPAKGPAVKQAGGYYLGPRGGKWEDAAHTIPWQEQKGGKGAAPERSTSKTFHGAKIDAKPGDQWKITKVKDVRPIDWMTGKRLAIPESQTPECDRCGQRHVKVWTMRNERSGAQVEVGSGCGPKLAFGGGNIDDNSKKVAMKRMREELREEAQGQVDKWASEVVKKVEAQKPPKLRISHGPSEYDAERSVYIIEALGPDGSREWSQEISGRLDDVQQRAYNAVNQWYLRGLQGYPDQPLLKDIPREVDIPGFDTPRYRVAEKVRADWRKTDHYERVQRQVREAVQDLSKLRAVKETGSPLEVNF